ncbi:MAG: GNAT family N-acetyltransferase [Coriobacteriaceae bacterium]|jgi:ribosomal protein S18 acetylase RimI-like enzyme|nr:GNAT family N-acetyltransferase [Coriobacteriaceae bacterium]
MPHGYRIVRSNEGIDFDELAALLKSADLADFDAVTRKKAFEGSSIVAYVFQKDLLVGCGRALSDGAYEAALYDVAVLPAYQGRGLGRLIVETILAELEGQNVIFFASVGKEAFYEKLGCLRMSTGMAHWRNPQRMRERGYSA